MACGLPIVCTELGTGTSYVNQDGTTGLVVPPSNAQELAKALQQLVSEPTLRKQMGKAGRRRAYDQFSKEAMITQILAFYRQVLQG
jgi:rhamnosyl/mannosyltransferase